MPLNVGVQEGHVALIEVVSNEEWKEYNMKHRAITLAFAACFLTSLALASDTLTFDSSRSNAQLFQGSKANSDSVNTGVARVTGMVKLDTNDLETSVLDLSIYPADEEWEPALNPEGALPTGYVPDATDQILLTFTRVGQCGAQGLEARVGAERIEARPQQDARVKSLFVGFFEPIHRLIRISQRCIDHGNLRAFE
jgi:hypothetical protein